jgi:hypothetical protein
MSFRYLRFTPESLYGNTISQVIKGLDARNTLTYNKLRHELMGIEGDGEMGSEDSSEIPTDE